MKVIIWLFLLTISLIGFTQDPKKIEIIRDQYGVPHIYAPTDAGVSYGLAWAHAEDDFNTIQLTMLAAKQMLGSHLGKDGATIDYVVGLLRCEEIVNANIEKVSPEFMAIVKGYAAGLNAYALNNPKELHIKNAFPINEKDIFKAYVLQLAVMDGADRTIKDLFDNKVPHSKPKGIGSNAIAVSRERTTDEFSYLAVNSHQPLEGAAAWYEAHLVSDEGWNALGGLFPGGPVIFHGTNEYLGWAHTVNYPDKIDVFQLEMHPEYENKYKVDDRWYDLDVKKVKLKVKVLLGLKITVKKDAFSSIYGPVVKNDSGVFAFNMSVFQEMRAIEQWYEMNKATNLKEFKEALSKIRIPSFNIVYADSKSNIFYVSNGLIPHRNPKYDWSSTLPGNTLETKSKSFHEFGDLPQITNPKSGYLFNMNNSPFHSTAFEDNMSYSDFDGTMGFVERENNRSTRMKELMNTYSDKISWSEFNKIKYDAQLPDSLVYAININPLFRMSKTSSNKSNQVLGIIQSWDKQALSSKVGPAHLLLTYEFLAENELNTPKKEDFILALEHTFDYLITHFKKIDITLGEYQKLVRGEKELPLAGIPDVITAMYGTPYKDGMIKGLSGESYIMMIRYPANGLPIVETVNVYGASNRQQSPHYNDQMELFTNRKLKSMTLDLNEVRKSAKNIYNPK